MKETKKIKNWIAMGKGEKRFVLSAPGETQDQNAHGGDAAITGGVHVSGECVRGDKMKIRNRKKLGENETRAPC